MTRLIPIAVASILWITAPAFAEEPGCVSTCKSLKASGALRNGVSVEGCKVRVCQEDGRREYREARYEASLASLDQVGGALRESPSYALDRGLTLYALADFEGALENFDKVLESFEESLRAGAQRAHALVRLGRYDEAIKAFELLEKAPGAEKTFRGLRTSSYLRGNIGVAHLLSGDLKSAKAALAEALEFDGRNSQASIFTNQVLAAIEAGELDGEGAALLLAASEDAGLKQYQRAAETLDVLIERSPKFGPSYHLQVEILVGFRQFETCEKALERGIRARPDDIDIRAEQLRCRLLRFGPTSSEAEPTVAELKRLREAHPDNERVWQILHMLDRS